MTYWQALIFIFAVSYVLTGLALKRRARRYLLVEIIGRDGIKRMVRVRLGGFEDEQLSEFQKGKTV